MDCNIYYFANDIQFNSSNNCIHIINKKFILNLIKEENYGKNWSGSG